MSYIHILETFSQQAIVSHHNTWQSRGLDSTHSDMLEVLNFSYSYKLPESKDQAVQELLPNLPWADEHLAERLSGQPLNPPPSHVKWNVKTESHLSYIDPSKFSHSYPERYWPKTLLETGTRFKTADLNDLIRVICNDPTTRQAYLPIFFNEDITASLQGERVPCTLGYYFYIFNNRLCCNYIIRSCDVIRHLNNDLYMTWGLCKYMQEQINKNCPDLNLKLGTMLFICFNLHCFKNDTYTLKQRIAKCK